MATIIAQPGYVPFPGNKKRPNTLLTPPATNPAQPVPAPPAQPSGYVANPAPAPAPAPPSRILSPMNFDDELEKLLQADPRVAQLDQMQFDSIQRDMNAPDFGEADQKILDESIALAKSQADTRDKQSENVLAAAGLRGGGTMVKRFAESRDQFARDVLESSISTRTRALERNSQRRVEASSRAANFARAIRDKNVELAQALLQAYQSDRDAELSREQRELEREMFQENLQFNRDQFSEEQRARLKTEGFTDRQIAMAEEQQLWERKFRERQQLADEVVQNRNLDIQDRALSATVRQEDKRLALTEIKNNADISLADRVQQLAEEFGFMDREFDQSQFEWSKGFQDRQQDTTEDLAESEIEARREATALDRAKFNQLTDQLEREFGMAINQFELEKALRTGELDWKILESSRRYDLDVEREKNAWMQSQQAMALQEKLGMTELEIKKALGEEGLSIQREGQLLEKWMFQQNLDWNKEVFAKQLAAAKKRAKGGLFGKILKTIAGVGMGIVGVATHSPALIAAGASTVFGGTPADNAAIINNVMGAPVATPRTQGSAQGDYNYDPAQYG